MRDFFERSLAPIDTVEFVLAAIGALLLLRGGWSLYWQWRYPAGSVEVDELKVDTDDGNKLPAKALSAVIRERLFSGGLYPPPTVPSGSPVASFGAIVKASGISHATWLGEVISAIPSLIRPRYGHKVTGVLRTRPDGDTCGVSIELGNVRGRTELVATSWAESHAEAAIAAADAIFQEISSHRAPRARIPAWARWTAPGGRGLNRYQKGIELEEADRVFEAQSAYADAVHEEPRNALVRLRLANLFERLANSPGPNDEPRDRVDAVLDALDQYKQVLSLWPNLWQARYRLASFLSSKETWAAAADLTDEERDEVLPLLQQLIPSTNGEATFDRVFLLQESRREWETLRSEFTRFPLRPRTYGSISIVEIASLCTSLQLAIAEEAAPP